MSQSDNSGLGNVIQQELEQNGCTGREELWIVSVSGGSDSMVLLSILHEIFEFQVIAAHVNFRKRGEASAADERLVRDYCKNKGVALEVLDLESADQTSIVSGYSEDVLRTLSTASPGSLRNSMKKGNFQDTARRLRRDFLESVRHKYAATFIATAHHRDDQLETILQKILRGAAVENWAGIKTREDPWIRPMINVTKNQILDYAKKMGIRYRTDHSNLESDYARNMLRNQVFPKLVNLFPGWQDNLLRVPEFAELHQHMLEYLSEMTTETRQGEPADSRQQRKHPSDVSVLLRSKWLSLPEKLRIPVARNWVRGQTGFTGWSRGDVARLSDLEHIRTGQIVSVSRTISIIRDRDHFVIKQELQHTDEPEDQEVLPVTLDISGLGKRPVTIGGVHFSEASFNPEIPEKTLQLRRDVLPDQLILRYWQNGDRFIPFGMAGSQTVADHLANRKIASGQKKQTMVLASFDGSIFAVIFPHSLRKGEIGTIAEHARCNSEEQRVLFIQKT